VARKIPTLAELENEVKAAVPSTEEGLNLAVLLSTLVPASMVLEADLPWTFESLLREITDELSNTPKTVIAVSGANTPAPEKTTGIPAKSEAPKARKG